MSTQHQMRKGWQDFQRVIADAKAQPLLSPEPEHNGDAYGGRFDPLPDEIDKDLAIHFAVEAIIELFKKLGPESAHWITTSAIIAGEREARGNRW